MKKSIALAAAALALLMGMSQAHAGSVDGKLTKIRAYDDGKKGLFAIYGWNTLIFNQSRQLRRSRSRLECEVRTQPFQTHSWLELLSLKGLSDVLRFPLYGRVLHTAFWPE